MGVGDWGGGVVIMDGMGNFTISLHSWDRGANLPIL